MNTRIIITCIVLFCMAWMLALLAAIVVAEEPRTYQCVGRNGLVISMQEAVGCHPSRDVPRALKAFVTYSYEQDRKKGYITAREMKSEIRAELKTYTCNWRDEE